MAALILEGLTLTDLETLIRKAVKEELQQQAAPATEPGDIPYLTRRETAEMLRVSLVTLNQWVSDGKIKAYKSVDECSFAPMKWLRPLRLSYPSNTGGDSHAHRTPSPPSPLFGSHLIFNSITFNSHG